MIMEKIQQMACGPLLYIIVKRQLKGESLLKRKLE